MSLGDVNHQESGLASVLVVELIEGGNLPPEGRSSVTAENHDYWLFGVDLREANCGGVIELAQDKIRSRVAKLQMTSAGPRPQRLEWDHQKDFPWQVGHYAGEILRSPVHDSPHEGYKR